LALSLAVLVVFLLLLFALFVLVRFRVVLLPFV